MNSGNSCDRMTDRSRMFNRKVITKHKTLHVFEVLTMYSGDPDNLNYTVQLRYGNATCVSSIMVPNKKSELRTILQVLSHAVHRILPEPLITSVMSELATADFGQPSTSIRSKPDERSV